MLGLVFKIAAFVYSIIFWYLLLLDKSHWNNHSYLFGLISIMLALSDSNTVWWVNVKSWTLTSNFNTKSSQAIKLCLKIRSLDSQLNNLQQDKVPMWQYFLIRFQIFLVYFYAGIKKFNMEWIGGYSMRYLSTHWVFAPFR